MESTPTKRRRKIAVKPAAQAKPGFQVILNPPKEKLNWKDLKWKAIFGNLNLAQ